MVVKEFKETYYAPIYKTNPADHLLYYFENTHFEWKQKHTVLGHVSLNANELLLPPPFPE